MSKYKHLVGFRTKHYNGSRSSGEWVSEKEADEMLLKIKTNKKVKKKNEKALLKKLKSQYKSKVKNET